MNMRILVLGSGDVGSAVAHRLFRSGADVVLADEQVPAHPRRGMAFTDAWFDGTATLEGVVAQRVSDVGDLAAQCTVMDAIPCTAASTRDVFAALQPDVLFDARMRKRAVPQDLRELAAETYAKLRPMHRGGQRQFVTIGCRRPTPKLPRPSADLCERLLSRSRLFSAAPANVKFQGSPVAR